VEPVARKTNFLIFTLFLQIIVFVTVILDIPIARQVIGFVYFTFVPGLIITKLLRLNELDRLETVLFSVGFGVVFLIFSGFFISEALFLLGFSRPLSLIPLMIILSSFVIFGAVLVHLRRVDINLFGEGTLFRSFHAVPFACLPILAVVGVMCVNIYQNNLILLFVIILISVLFSIAVIRKELSPSSVYPFAVIMIALCLLYHSSLISNNLVSFNSDVPAEYFVFKITQNAAHWSSTPSIIQDVGYGRLNAMLSITILPTIYSTLLNLDPTWVFKVLFPTIFSLVPLCLYRLWEPNIGKKGAFIAAFLFMANMTFFTEMVGLNRQMVAELFFVLLLLVIFSKKLKTLGRTTCFIVFNAGLVVSHYGLAEIFLLFILVFVIYSILMRRPNRSLTVSMAVLFFTIMFSWYLYTSNASVFSSFVSYGNYVYGQLNQFLTPGSRGQEVLTGLGLTTPPTIWNSFGRAFAYLTEILVVLGFIGLITKRTGAHFEKEQYVLSTTVVILLVLLVLVPGLANTLGITRFYHVLLFFLAALCVLGAEFLTSLVFKQQHLQKIVASIFLLGVLVPYFLFQSGLVYEVTGSQSYSLPLSMHRMSQSFLRSQLGCFDESEVLGASWLSKSIDTQSSKLYSDASSAYDVLIDYGMIRFAEIISNVTVFSENSIVYLNRANLVEKTGMPTSVLPILDFTDKVYSNGGCEIYNNP